MASSKSLFHAQESVMRLSLVCSLVLAAALPLYPQSPAPAPSRPGGYYRMKKVTVVDEHGFERPMPALSLLVPSEWQFQGNVRYEPSTGCHADMVQVSFRATSPDNGLGIEMFPGVHWQWSDDPSAVRAMQAASQQAMRFGRRECEVMPSMTPEGFLRRWLIPRVRPDAKVLAIESMPDAAQKVREKAEQQQEMAVRAGMRMNIRAEIARARIAYSLAGRATEEWITAVTFSAATPGPSFNMATGQMGQTQYYNCGGYLIFAMRAPSGQLQAREKLFTLVLSTVAVEPEWQGRVTQVLLNMQAADSKGARDRSAIIAQSGREISGIIKQTYENRQKAQDASAAAFSQYIRGVETYRNPQTGESVELSNQYGRAWVNNSNEYILSDSPGFDPNVALKGNWTSLERAKP
jgi:hypothetical protein